MQLTQLVETILQRLENGETLVLDGALGAELIRQGYDSPLPLWSAAANLDCPEMVSKIHREYVNAGADIITTNTFRTTTRSYLKIGLPEDKARGLAKRSLINAVQAAREAAGDNCLVAGSIAPLEDCYSPGLFPGKTIAVEEFTEQGLNLKTAGVDFLLIETMGRIDETESVLVATESLKLPRWVSFILEDSEHLFGGDRLQDALSMIANFNVKIALLNCTDTEITLKGVRVIKQFWHGQWGAYPNLGLGEVSIDGNISVTISDTVFKTAIRRYIDQGASVIGTCCGSNPNHTQTIRQLLTKDNTDK